MSKIRQWKKIFTPNLREKVQVRVGSKSEELTVTQSYRFDELKKIPRPDPAPSDGPLEKSRYTLADASFRMMLSEQQILQKAAVGSVVLYADASGLQGTWRNVIANGGSKQSSMQTLASGYLALTVKSCSELADRQCTDVSVLEFPDPSNLAAAGIERRLAETLLAWGGGKTVYCLREPVSVDRNDVVLLG